MTTWAVQVYRDGEPVTGPVPTDAWAAADAFAEFLVQSFGGQVSIGNAVIDHLEDEKQAETLFGHMEAPAA